MNKICMLISICINLSIISQSYALTLTSSDISEGEMLAKNFEFRGKGSTCDGGNLSPQLQWEDVPKGTKSFAITMYDPDAPTGSGWWHWIATNIPKDKRELNRGMNLKKIDAIEYQNDYGEVGYGGACPPEGHGMHRYQFTIWALPVVSLDFGDNPSAARIGFTLRSMALDKATLTATYVR